MILQKRPKKFINNYGELPNYINNADGDPWDVIVPGYPSLDIEKPLRFKKLLGVYTLPDNNHKLIIDVHTSVKKHKTIDNDVFVFKRKYEKHNKISGSVIFF